MHTKGDLKLSIHGNSSPNSRVNINFGGTEESFHAYTRRRQDKGNKSNPSNKQRLFHSNNRNHNSGRSQGVVSESPPIGFFFGSTPPENNG